MIYVKRDSQLIPPAILTAAVNAQAELEALPQDQRAGFIKSKASVWRAFSSYLSQMSYGKCWYSESMDPQSFFDVDHFRPKLEAKRSETEVDTSGYEWLAFSWENFRYSATRSNRLNTNLDTGLVDGKGSWFPLLTNVKASWDNRCEADEKPILLDPVDRDDMQLIDVGIDGRIEPSKFAFGSARLRVERSCEIYGLNLPGIKAARLRLMREMHQLVEALCKTAEAIQKSNMPNDQADNFQSTALAQIAMIRQKTSPSSPYSRAARAALASTARHDLCAFLEYADCSAA